MESAEAVKKDELIFFEFRFYENNFVRTLTDIYFIFLEISPGKHGKNRPCLHCNDLVRRQNIIESRRKMEWQEDLPRYKDYSLPDFFARHIGLLSGLRLSRRKFQLYLYR